ncbi:hypothetical protein ACHAWF_012075 [Thalassiosira exigua]
MREGNNGDYGELPQRDSVGHHHSECADAQVEILRRQREQAFHEMCFAEVAQNKAADGHVTMPSPVVSASANTTTSDSCLSTPLIDISTLGGADSGGGHRSLQQQQSLHGENPTIAPEAGLHRDGEQARLVEVVRRRQEQERRHNEDTTFEWLEESASQFWESILVYGGLIEDPRNNVVNQNTPLNPYQDDGVRQPTNEIKSNIDRSRNISSTDAKRIDNNDPALHSTTDPAFLSNHPRIIRILCSIIWRILCRLRRVVDTSIMRWARLGPIVRGASSVVYSTPPVYTLDLSADDILISIGVLLVSYYYSSRAQSIVPVVVVVWLLMRTISWKTVKRTHTTQNQQMKMSSRHSLQQIGNDPISSKDPKVDRQIQKLQKLHPHATEAECKRFFACVKYKEEAASKRIDDFLKWRSDCGLATKSVDKPCNQDRDDATKLSRNARVFDQVFAKKDEQDWMAAAKLAISIMTKSHATETLPQILCSYEEQLEDDGDNGPINAPNTSSPPRGKDGTRIFHILPARVDFSLATAPTYSLAAALYLDRRLSRFSTERITLLCDLRGGNGWANPTPWSALPFVQSTSSLLGNHYPERLERFVLFPLPKSATWVWSAAQKFLDPNTASKVLVVSSAEDGCIPEEMDSYFHKESLDALEKRRKSFFYQAN